MQSINLNKDIRNSVIVPFDEIIYPNDRYAIYNGDYFFGAPIKFSPQFRTCSQVDKGEILTNLHYYKWTLEKLDRFGERFEHLLLSKNKGCGVSPTEAKKIRSIDSQAERFAAYASVSTGNFVNLYKSISNEWNPNISKNDIVLFKLRGGKYTIFEGRHRICILMYNFMEQARKSFKIDDKMIRKDYYSIRLRKIFKEFLWGKGFVRSCLKRKKRA